MSSALLSYAISSNEQWGCTPGRKTRARARGLHNFYRIKLQRLELLQLRGRRT